MDTSKCMRYI